MKAFVCAVVLALFAEAALAASWSCYGAKPGHPTADERAAFVSDVSPFAIAAERKHGVPAAALVALAAVESEYGWTRLALEANNLFAWKAGPVEAKTQKTYVPVCQQRRKTKGHFAVFASRAEAFDTVASKLATLDGFREYTERYRVARKRGEPLERSVNAWVAGIATRYSREPRVFSDKLVRVMNDPEQRGDAASRQRNLYELSRQAGSK